MNKEDFKNIKLFIGPMSKNIVDSAINFCNKFNVKLGFIPSRRQIDFDSGYVNNWNTRSFSEYVKSKTDKIVLERDHGGPEQGQDLDDGNASFFQDANNFDIIHVDVWKKYKKIHDGINQTINYIKFCNHVNSNVLFEVGTEEAIRKTTVYELDFLMYSLKKNLNENIFNKIIYLVVQSGTSLLENKNTGKYDRIKLQDMVEIANKYNVLSKEHNGDYIEVSDIHDRFNYGLDAINIAPEFGQIETNAILELIDGSGGLFEKYYDICLNSNRWIKWVGKNFKPEENKLELIKICGHYVLSYNEMKQITNNFSNELQKLVEKKVYEKLHQILLQ